MEQKIQAIKFKQHLTAGDSYVRQHHFAEEYKDKSIEKQFPCFEENPEIRETYIRHPNKILAL